MGLELNPTERRFLPAVILAGAGLSLFKLVGEATGKVGAGEPLTAPDYAHAFVTCALIYIAVRLKRRGPT